MPRFDVHTWASAYSLLCLDVNSGKDEFACSGLRNSVL